MQYLELIFVKVGPARDVTSGGMERFCAWMIRALAALSLALSGAASAMPLMHGAGLTQIEICADGQASTIMLDRDGNPVEPAVECPDCPVCGTAPAALLQSPLQVLTQSFDATRALAGLTAVSALPRRHPVPQPRGPPPVDHGAIDLALAAATGAAPQGWVFGPCQPNGQPITVALT